MAVSCTLENAINFEPLGGVTTVFFDDKSQQIFSVRSRGATGVMVKGFSDNMSSTFRLEDRGSIVSIKLSPDQKVLAIQRAKSTVEFFNVTKTGINGTLHNDPYTQDCKAKNATILGFYWNSNTEIVYLTSNNIEVYSVLADRRLVKYARHVNQLITWFVYCPSTSILVLSLQKYTACLFVYFFKNGNVLKLPKIDVSRGSSDQSKVEVREKDVSVVSLYDGQEYVAVILHPLHGQNGTSIIQLYEVSRDATTTSKAHVLRVPFDGTPGLGLHVIDDVIVVHNRKAGETCLFDVGLGGESDGHISHHKPVCPVTSIDGSCSSCHGLVDTSTEYPSHWVIFAPDIIIDANIGVMWKLSLKMETLPAFDSVLPVTELPRLVGFLLQRRTAKRVLLDTLLYWCLYSGTDLGTIGSCFARINREYRIYIDNRLAPSLALPASTFPTSASTSSLSATILSMQKPSKVILDQADVYTNLMSPLMETATAEDAIALKRVTAIVLEYIRSLEERQIPAQHFLHELLINLLVRDGRWYQLHQLLQYRIISDSKPLACLLLSLEAAYPASFQLALDMLARLKTSTEEIAEVMLSKGHVLSAIKYADRHGLETVIQARKFLEAAKETNDAEVFLQTYNWLSDRNLLQTKDVALYATSLEKASEAKAL